MSNILSGALSDVLRSIPLQKRRELSAQIQILCENIKIENVFMVNQLSFNAQKRAEVISAKAVVKKDHMPRYWVYIEGQTVPKACTLAEAASLMKVTETSLKVRVSSVRAFEKEITVSEYRGKDHISGRYVCSKMSQDELDEQLRILNEKIKSGSIAQNSIQSASPTRP
jgi:hypothetical protein